MIDLSHNQTTLMRNRAEKVTSTATLNCKSNEVNANFGRKAARGREEKERHLCRPRGSARKCDLLALCASTPRQLLQSTVDF